VQNSNTRLILIGAILLIGGFLFDKQLKGAGGETLYYVALLIGAVVLILGFVRQQKEGGIRADLSEDEIAHEALLKTLARMTDADFNIMQVEIDSVCKVYKDLTGKDVTSADVRVAAKGDLFEEAKFQTYLGSVASKVSGQHKLLIMKGLATVMKADGVIDPLEIGFFNDVAKALKMEPGDLIGLTD